MKVLNWEEVESTASDPHLCGPIEIAADPGGVRLRWAGSEDSARLEWYEALVIAGAKPNELLKASLEELREQTIKEAYEFTAKEAAEMDDAVYAKGYKDGFEAGQKVIRMKRITPYTDPEPTPPRAA